MKKVTRTAGGGRWLQQVKCASFGIIISLVYLLPRAAQRGTDHFLFDHKKREKNKFVICSSLCSSSSQNV